MKTWKKIMIGGLGALTPIVMNLLIVDINVLLMKLTLFAFLGYLVRVVVLFYLGGLVAYFHKSETSPLKLFELGIVAPALITALINAGHVKVPEVIAQTNEPSTASVFFIGAGYAQPPQEEEIKTFALPKETSIQQLWRGLTGSSSKKVWFVIVGSHLNLEDARNQKQQINQRGGNIKAEVYAPYGDNPNYSVVIGANQTDTEAQELRNRAIDLKISEDVRLWTFPNRR